MTAETRTGPERAPNGDIVVSIDAMGGDSGVSEVVRGMAMSLEKNPRLRYLLHGDGELRRPHHVCGACGHYDGREVVAQVEEVDLDDEAA